MEKTVSLPAPTWVEVFAWIAGEGSNTPCALGNAKPSLPMSEEKAKNEIEEFLRALPKELLPSWAQPPQK